MAPIVGHAAIAISAVIVGTTAIIIWISAVIDGAAIVAVVGGAALRCGDRKSGPDNTGKSCSCGSATAAPIEPAAGAEVRGIAGRRFHPQALCPCGGARPRPRPLR